MIYLAALRLQRYRSALVKVGDTPADVERGETPEPDRRRFGNRHLNQRH
jgi:hypothetical protein